MNSYEPYTFGELLRGFRKRHGLTQAELAQALKVSRITIANWERSAFLPRYRDQVVDLQDVLCLSDEEANRLLTAAYYPRGDASKGLLQEDSKLGSTSLTRKNQPKQIAKPTRTWLDPLRNLAAFFFEKDL